MRKTALVIVFSCMLVLSGCGGGSSQQPSQEGTEATSQQDALYNEACEELLNKHLATADEEYQSEFASRPDQTFLLPEDVETARTNALEYFDETFEISVGSFSYDLEQTDASDEAVAAYTEKLEAHIAELRAQLNAAFDTKLDELSPEARIADKPALSFEDFVGLYAPLYNWAHPTDEGFHDFDAYEPMQTEEVAGTWTYLMIADFIEPSEASMAELGQATFICDLEHSRGSMELFPYQMRNADGSISDIDPEEGGYLPFTGDMWENPGDSIKDTGTIWLRGGTDHDDPGETDFQTFYMFRDSEGHEYIVGQIGLPVGGVTYWMVFMR